MYQITIEGSTLEILHKRLEERLAAMRMIEIKEDVQASSVITIPVKRGPYQKRKPDYIHWDAEQEEELRSLYTAHMTVKRIAKKMNRTKAAVISRIKKLRERGVNIPKRKERRPSYAPTTIPPTTNI